MNRDLIDNFSKLIFNESEDDSIFTESTSENVVVYQYNYLLGLISVLERYYVSVSETLGQENFRYFSRQYIEQNPSQSPNLDDYGEEFPIFISQRKELNEIGYVYYLAQLDWFWFSKGQEGLSIKLPKGILNLWGKIINKEELSGIEIDEEEVEEIIICIDENKDFFMKVNN